jgi:hypothetical protein
LAQYNRLSNENQQKFSALLFLGRATQVCRSAEARQRYQEYLDRFPWGEHAPEALAALERLGEK